MPIMRRTGRPMPATVLRSRWSERLLGLVVYLLVLAVLAALVVFAVRYQPLTIGNFASSEPVRTGNMIHPVYTNGSTFSFGFMLINDGPVPLNLQRIQFTGNEELLAPVRVETSEKRGAGSIAVGDPSLEKFLPFSLDGGGRRWIVIRTQFSNCDRYPAGTFTTFWRLKVTYRVLAFTKSAWIELPRDIRVDSPPDFACPSRS